jgi:hypothetical protein
MLDPRVCPPHLPPLRLLDPLLAQRMATFALWAVINCHRRWWASGGGGGGARAWGRRAGGHRLRVCSMCAVGLGGVCPWAR